jgi:cathepsin L
MQKSQILISVLALLTAVSIFKVANIETIKSAQISPLIGAEVHTLFNDYLVQFKKSYTPEEKIFRLSIFYKSYIEITEQNKRKSTWRAGLNRMSDMTPEEIKVKYSITLPDTEPVISSKILNKKFNADPPVEMNWVTAGAVT